MNCMQKMSDWMACDVFETVIFSKHDFYYTTRVKTKFKGNLIIIVITHDIKWVLHVYIYTTHDLILLAMHG